VIIDTHCHLDDVRYREDLDAVIKKAWDVGVQGILIPGADSEDLERAQAIAHQHENIFFAAGIHPYHHEQYDEKRLRKFLQDPKCIAVGECGLDYYRLPEVAQEKVDEILAQKEVFKKHIRLAIELNKPLIVHIREANDDSKSVLLEENASKVGGVLHCYNASKHLLDLADHGFYFGIGGVITFKNAKALVEILPLIPREKLLLETDGPYLTPMPFRGERNEPSYTVLVAQKVAELLHVSVTELHDLTTNNAISLFKAFKK
jgi:TatD DNase family protein